MLYGLDFGTSNSTISLFSEAEKRIITIPVEQGHERADIINTLIYIGRDGRQLIGREASDAYFKDNVGREVVKSKVNTGETFKSYVSVMGEVTESIVIEVDTGVPGRFFQSIKSFLGDEFYSGTEIWGKFMGIEELVALFLGELKKRADSYNGQAVDGVVLGRPVYFSPDGTGDEIAQERLREGAKLAGFKEIHFQYEPVAAALHYEKDMAQQEEFVLVFDFGGGTLDTSVIRVNPERINEGNRRDDILATSGRVIGGNTLDEEIMEQRLFKYFGENALWSEQRLRLPSYIFGMLRHWYTIPNLQVNRVYSFLEDISRMSDGRKQIKALDCLIRKNYGFALYQEIERAKVLLSSEWETRITFFEEAIAIDEYLSRINFETIITGYLKKIEQCIDETLTQAGIKPEQIQAVLRTGGSSNIPAVQKLLERKFGRRTLRFQDAFASVASGLGIAAAHGTWFD
jgi:hypothetical chaperone protein